MNQGGISVHYLFISLDDEDANLHCISNAKHLLSETVSPKNHGQVSLDKKGYQDALIFFSTANLPAITTYTRKGGQIYSP